jgi:8-oxo-dGTP diphosphatase/2-hydroxy-dATP diphosphatase
MAIKLLTLCIVHENDRVLLGMKKRGFGAGRYNGFGGKVDTGETIEEAALREVREEAGITPNNLLKLGRIEFTFTTHEDVLQVHIFKTTAYEGQAGESEEMRPEWFSVDHVPFADMWKDDIFWFPLFLQNKKFAGKFHFDDKDEILEKELREVSEPE